MTKVELLSLLTELAETDREAYREVRAEIWSRVARNHKRKTPSQISEWLRVAS